MTQNIAYVTFDNFMNALAAQKALNNYYLKDLNVLLSVNFCQNSQDYLLPMQERLVSNNSAPPMYQKQLSSDSTKLKHILGSKNGKNNIFTFGPDAIVKLIPLDILIYH